MGNLEEQHLLFRDGPSRPKGRNLKNNPRIVVHVQDGWDTVILEGSVSREVGRSKLASLKSDFVKKYRYAPDWSNPKTQRVFRVKPVMVHAWKAPRMHRSLVKFVF